MHTGLTPPGWQLDTNFSFISSQQVDIFHCSSLDQTSSRGVPGISALKASIKKCLAKIEIAAVLLKPKSIHAFFWKGLNGTLISRFSSNGSLLSMDILDHTGHLHSNNAFHSQFVFLISRVQIN